MPRLLRFVGRAILPAAAFPGGSSALRKPSRAAFRRLKAGCRQDCLPHRLSFATAILLLALSGCGKKHIDQAPRSPQESLRSIHVNPGFKVELFASEPLVFDPVEIAFDENGRMFVAEMLDYPEDPPPGQPARSRVVMLEDTNGDGI